MSNISYAFDGRTVVVTGSARGIGKEVARLFVEARAAVYLMDPDADEVNRAADELGATAIVGNVSSTEDAESAIAQMIQRYRSGRHRRQQCRYSARRGPMED